MKSKGKRFSSQIGLLLFVLIVLAVISTVIWKYVVSPLDGKGSPPSGISKNDARVKPGKGTDVSADTFRFIVLGDSRGGSDAINEHILRNLLARIKRLSPQPAFILFTGDMVKGGAVKLELSQWQNIVDDYFPLQIYYPAIGNHEGNENIFNEMFAYLPDGQLSGFGRTAYFFDYANTRIVTLNSIRKDHRNKYVIDAEQRKWLENVLKSKGKRHVFVQLHIPPYPASNHTGESLDANPFERDAFWSVLDKYKVDAVLVGHEHNYSRRKVDSSFSANGFNFQNSIYQITVGGAGAPLYRSVKNKKNVEVGPLPVYHFMVVDVKNENVQYSVYDINGNKIDAF